MDINIKELLINRLNTLEFQGNHSPTMGMISKNNLNPKFFKLKKIFSKKRLNPKSPQFPKLHLGEILKSSHPHKSLNFSTPTPDSFSYFPIKSKKRYNLTHLPSLTRLDYHSIKATKTVRRKKLPKLSIDTCKILNCSDIIANFRTKKLQLLQNTSSLSPSSPSQSPFPLPIPSKDGKLSIYQSVEVSSSKRQIIFSKSKHDSKSKDFSGFYDVFENHMSSESSVSNL